MPVVKFFACLDLDQNSSFDDENYKDFILDFIDYPIVTNTNSMKRVIPL